MEKNEYAQEAIKAKVNKIFGTTFEYAGLIMGLDGALRSHSIVEIATGFVAYLTGRVALNYTADARIIELNRDLILNKLTGLQGKVAETEKPEGIEAKIEN